MCWMSCRLSTGYRGWLRGGISRWDVGWNYTGNTTWYRTGVQGRLSRGNADRLVGGKSRWWA